MTYARGPRGHKRRPADAAAPGLAPGESGAASDRLPSPVQARAADGTGLDGETRVSYHKNMAALDAAWAEMQAAAGDRAVHRPEGGGAVGQMKPDAFTGLGLLQIKTGYGMTASTTHPFSDDAPFEDLKDAVRAYGRLAENNINGRQDALVKMERMRDLWVNGPVPAPNARGFQAWSRKAGSINALNQVIATERNELGVLDDTVDVGAQTLRAIRFQGDYLLEQIAGGTTTLTGDEVGMPVLKIQQALIDAGYAVAGGPGKKMNHATVAALTQFQADKGIAQTGHVDQATMQALDTHFRTYTSEVTVADSGDTVGTRVPDVHEKRGIKSAMSTGVKVDATTGQLPVFVNMVTGQSYKARLKAKVEEIVDAQYQAIGEGKGVLHADPANLLGEDLIENIAAQSKAAVDAVFGKYKTSAAFTFGVNIFDAWDDKVAQLNTTEAEDDAVTWRVTKIITGKDEIKTIDRLHGAVQSRSVEEGIINEVVAEVTAAKRNELLETHKGWPGYADNGRVYIQRFREGNAAGNRNKCWKLFRTCMHEYIHTLEHPNSKILSHGLGQKVGGFTIREGFTDYFTKIAWSHVAFDTALRQAVEGPFYVDDNHPIPAMGAYPESANAERVAGLVGVKNLYASYFNGLVDRIKY